MCLFATKEMTLKNTMKCAILQVVLRSNTIGYNFVAFCSHEYHTVDSASLHCIIMSKQPLLIRELPEPTSEEMVFSTHSIRKEAFSHSSNAVLNCWWWTTLLSWKTIIDRYRILDIGIDHLGATNSHLQQLSCRLLNKRQ